MNDYKLILHPHDPFALPDPAALIEALTRIELIGRRFHFRDQGHFLPGEEFMHLITFLGCSPHIEFEPPADGSERGESDFCHLFLRGPFAEPEFLADQGVKPPRCPACRQPEPEWPKLVSAWREDRSGYRHHCTHCGASHPLPQLKWRHSAGFGRLAIDVWGVFEGEAVPGEALLQRLAGLGCGEWDYFYTSSDKP